MVTNIDHFAFTGSALAIENMREGKQIRREPLEKVSEYLSSKKKEYESALKPNSWLGPHYLFNYVNNAISKFFNIEMNDYRNIKSSSRAYLEDMNAGLSLILDEINWVLNAKEFPDNRLTQLRDICLVLGDEQISSRYEEPKIFALVA